MRMYRTKILNHIIVEGIIMKRQPTFNVRFFNEERKELTKEEIFETTVVGEKLAKFHATWVVGELAKIEDENLRLDTYKALIGDRVYRTI